MWFLKTLSGRLTSQVCIKMQIFKTIVAISGQKSLLEVNMKNEIDILNENIHFDEIEFVFSKLKNNKYTQPEGIRNKVLKIGIFNLFSRINKNLFFFSICTFKLHGNLSLLFTLAKIYSAIIFN